MSRQNGFTLIELLVGLAIGSSILIVTVALLFTIQIESVRSRSQMVIDYDVNLAASAIQQDLYQSQETNLIDGEPPQTSISLTWMDHTGDEPSPHSSSYALDGTVLSRIYDGVTEIVGRDITYLGFTKMDRWINVTITSSKTESQEFPQTLRFGVLQRTEDEAE